MFITYREALSPKLLSGIGASKTMLGCGRAFLPCRGSVARCTPGLHNKIPA